MHALLRIQLVKLPPGLAGRQVTGFHKEYDARGTDVQRLSPIGENSHVRLAGPLSGNRDSHPDSRQIHRIRFVRWNPRRDLPRNLLPDRLPKSRRREIRRQENLQGSPLASLAESKFRSRSSLAARMSNWRRSGRGSADCRRR